MKTAAILKTLVSCLMLASFVGCDNSDSKYQSQFLLKAKQLQKGGAADATTDTDTRTAMPVDDSADENPMQAYNDIKNNSASSDTTTTCSADQTRSASGDNTPSQKSSPDETSAAPVIPKPILLANPNLKSSADQTIVVSKDSTQAISGDQSRARSAETSKAASADESVAQINPDIGSLKFTEIKILDENLLKTINQQDFRILFENYLSTDARVQSMMSNRAYGVACKFTVAGELNKNDKLSFKEITNQVATAKEADSKVTVKFENSKAKLEMNCVYQGKISQKYYEENLFEVVDFKTAKGTYKSETEKQLTYEQIVEKTKTFKVLNVENLKKIEVNNTTYNKKRSGMIEGRILDEAKSIELVRNGRARQACAIIGLVGELKKDQIFTQAGIKPLVEYADNNYAEMQIFYTSLADQTEIALHCALRRNGVGPGIIFETFKGTLEYGAK